MWIGDHGSSTAASGISVYGPDGDAELCGVRPGSVRVLRAVGTQTELFLLQRGCEPILRGFSRACLLPSRRCGHHFLAVSRRCLKAMLDELAAFWVRMSGTKIHSSRSNRCSTWLPMRDIHDLRMFVRGASQGCSAMTLRVSLRRIRGGPR